MLWWVGAFLVWLVSFVWIVAVMAGVFRGKNSILGKDAMFGYGLHGVTAVLALWMALQAMGS